MSHATTETKTTVAISINGASHNVPTGTTILQAARRAGHNIPTLCYLAKTHSIGSCRVCSVEVEGVSSPVMSCTTPAADGMVVYTDTPKINEFRKNMIEFILVNHPLDCPVCERSGECQLQNLTMKFGIQKPRWKTTEHKKVPKVDWGLIQYDRNLCIMCERCVSVCREVQGVAAYKIDGRGNAARINTTTGEKLDCNFCGQCISVCPVGALSSGIYFSSRSWEVKKSGTVCPHCGVGCSFAYDVKDGKIIRVTSRDGIGNNRGNLCARGRFGFEYIQGNKRLNAPLIKRGSGFVSTDWDTALDFVAHNLKKHAGAKNAVAGIGSERATNEDNYVFQKFFRDVLASGNLDNLANMAGSDTASGIFDSFGDFPMTATFNELKSSKAIVYVGMDGSNENPVIGNVVREAINDHGAEVALMFSKEATFLPNPKLSLVYDYANLNATILALIDGVAQGGFAGGAPVTSDVSQKAASAAGQLTDADLKSGLSDLASLLRKKGSPVFLVGSEAQSHPQAGAIVRNIVNLAKITGGRVMLMREYCNSQGVNDMGVAPNVLPGYAKETRPALKIDGGLVAGLNNGSTKALFVADEDPLRRLPDYFEFRSAMDKAEFVVVCDQFYTETAMAADVILPSCTSAEKDGTFTNIEGRIQRIKSAVEPVGQSRPMWRIIADLAKRMGSDFGYARAKDVTAEIASAVPMYADVQKDSSFAGYAGKISRTQELKVLEPAKVATTGGFVILPNRSLFALGVYTDNCPSLVSDVCGHYPTVNFGGRPGVDMNPADAKRLGCADGDTAVFKHPKREINAGVVVNSAVKGGTIRVPEEMDLFASVKLIVNGREIECVNRAGMGGK
ncbi:MAG: molybdopterin-dependent oxidoreductase [Nitrospinae bacterium]|nr:molybdopterin-dependent oxidoreductase [Nitrospinota bacterium]